jgi:hypothetical protein
MLQPHGDVEPVEARRDRDTSIDQDRAQAGTAIGKSGNLGLLYLTNLGKAALDQRRDRGVGFGDRGEDLPESTGCLDMGASRLWGYPIEQDMTSRVFHRLGIRNGADLAPVEERDRHASGLAMEP